MFSVIFDMDGTLLDTQRICIPAWEYAGRLQGIDGAGELIRKVCGMNEAGWSKVLEDTYAGLDLPQFKRDLHQYIDDNLVVRYKPGAVELIEFLKKNKIKIALASGTSRKSVMHHLKEVGAEDIFETIVCGNEVANGKPAPDVFLKVAENLDVEPGDCFVFEDSNNGVRSAHAAGMRCIGIPDVVDFADDVKPLLFAQIECLSDAIEILKEYL